MRRPDFCVSKGGERFFVEALRSFAWAEETPGRNAGLEAHVLDWINDVRSSDFMVHVEFLSVGRDQPSRQRVQQPLEEWLSTLDVDALFAVRAQRGIHALTPMRLRPRDGWEILVHPIPMSPEHRRPRDRLIGIGPTSGGWVIEESRIADGLRAKGKRYDVGEHPLVVAVMPESITFGDDKAANVLYGDETREFDPLHPEGGEFTRRGGVFDARQLLSAVLFGAGVALWTLESAWPRLWQNPTAMHPLPTWAFPSAPQVWLDESGALAATDPDRSICQVLGLPVGWPPSDPFPGAFK